MKNANQYQICTKCIMDTSDPDIEFDENGVCNHCRRYDKLAAEYVFTGKDGEQKFQQIIDKIKRKGKNSQYDCIIVFGQTGALDYIQLLV